MIFGCLVWSSISDGREIGYSNVLPSLPIPSSWTKLPVHALSTSWTHWQTNLNDLGYFLIFWCFYQITGLFTSSPILTSCPKPTSSQLISAHLFYDKTSSSKYFFQSTFFPKTNSCHLSCGSQASNACLVCSGSLQFSVQPSRPLILILCLANGFFCGQPVHMDIHSNAGLLAPCNTHAQVRHLWPHLAV